jgi:syntaxin-binding protein 1
MPRSPNGAKLIVFVIGGAAYSEIRSAYEIAETYNRDVFIGTTEILRPTAFIDHLGNLKHPVPPPPSVIAPYVPPQQPQLQKHDSAVSKTASLMSHMHINTANTTLSNKSSSMSLDKLSATSDDSSKEKKKKKGLGRFFG